MFSGEKNDDGVGGKAAKARCCISHEFLSAASQNPSRTAVIRSSGVPDGGDRVSSYPPIYCGDEIFNCADLISSVDSLSLRLRRVLDGGDDPGLTRPQAQGHLHGSLSAPSSGDPDGISCFSGIPQIVGVYISPSVEYIVAVLSILRCGEAFLPLDPLWPEERILSVLASSRTSIVIRCPQITLIDHISRPDAVDWIVARSGCSVLCLNVKAGLEEHFVHSNLTWPCESKSPRKFCYLMYTSGSTGKPKGVCGTEIGLLNRFWWMQENFPLCGGDVLLFKTSVSFVDHLQEFLSAILTCTPLVVPPFDDFKANPLCIVNYLKAYHISRFTSVPSVMRAILSSFEISEWMPIRKTLKVLVLSGEILSLTLWRSLHEFLPETIILNLYGSTEVSGDCTYFDCRSLSKILEAETVSSVPIGIPITNCKIDLLGETNTPSEGEISVGGMCLFSGYFGEPIDGNPTKDKNTTLHFRTGDFAKRLQSGDLVFLWRKDRIVKVNGQRVALEEIENTIREHPEISDACATIQEAHEGLSFLEAFLVIKVNERLQKGHIYDRECTEELITSIRSWLVSKLPTAMIPSCYNFIERLPISASGKINYAMLTSSVHKPKRFRVDYGEAVSSEGPLQTIKEAFRDALLVEVSDDDDFFMMGGDSIFAAHVAQKLGIDMRLLYVFPTPRSLLSALLAQNNLHEIIFTPPVSLKRTKVLEGTASSSDTSTMDMQSTRLRLLGAPMQAITGEGVHDLFARALNGANSISGHGDLWFSNFGTPECSFSRCNQFMVGSENRLRNVHQAWLLTKIPRHEKGCLQELWKVLLKSCVDASPLVVHRDGNLNLFIGSHSHIFMSLDAISGLVRWEVTLEGRIECSAAITGDFTQVVVGCYKGKIYFLDYMTGNICWTFQTDGEVKMQPVADVDRNLIWCGSHDHYLYALDHKKHCCVYKISCGGSIYGSPSLDMVRNMIYVASTSGRVSGISLEVMPFRTLWLYESGAPIFGSLTLDLSSGYVICCLVNGHVLALNSRGVVIWKVTLVGPVFAGACISPALPSQVLICSRSGIVCSFDLEGGDLLWDYDVGDPITASAYVDEQSRIDSDPSDPYDRLVCVCSSSGSVHLLKVNSNVKEQRGHQDDAVFQSSMVQKFAAINLPGHIFSSPVMIGGRIFVGCRDDFVYCIKLVVT